MTIDELIKCLKSMNGRMPSELDEETRNLFYAIMRIADERDEYYYKTKNAIAYLELNSNFTTNDIDELKENTLDILKGRL